MANIFLLVSSFLFVVFIAVPILKASGSSIDFQRIRASFGEPCERGGNKRCNASNSLTCRDGICDCVMFDTMIYDSEKQGCAVLAGEKCFYTTVSTDDTRGKMWKEEVACVTNASCSSSTGLCTCNSNFFEAENGTCIPKKTYDEECFSNRHCREDLHFICQDNSTCNCNSSYTVYHPTLEKCVSKIGMTCRRSQMNCPENAMCKNRYEYYNDYEGKCNCFETHYPTELGNCYNKSNHGESCNSDMNCLERNSLVCINGTCLCNPSATIYDPDKMECLTFAGSLCIESYQRSTWGARACVDNAECVEENSRSYYPYQDADGLYWKRHCACNSISYQTPNKTCTLKGDFDDECDSNEQCLRDSRFRKVDCISGKCKCVNPSSVVDRDRKICARLFNDTCEDDDECIPYGDCYNRRCICMPYFTPSKDGYCRVGVKGHPCNSGNRTCNYKQGLICVDDKCQCEFQEKEYFDDKLKKCSCKSKYFLDENGSCQPKRNHSEACSKNDMCREDFDLICANNSCECNSKKSLYSGEKDLSVCKRIPNAACGKVASDIYKECVENAYCHKISGTCVCNADAYESTNKSCIPKNGHGESCTFDYMCNSAQVSNLVCRSMTCSCKSGYLYNQTRNACVLLATYDNVCNNDGNMPCDKSHGLICLGGKCQCEHADYQFYSRDLKGCISYVEGPCGNASQKCISNSECVEMESGDKQCKCKPGFVPVEGECDLAFGELCDDYVSPQLKCDRLGPLQCRDGKCLCGNYQHYDMEQFVCK